MLTQRSQDIFKKVKDLWQQHQFQTLLQDNQTDEDIKKFLAVIFNAGNIREEINIDENLFDTENYLDNNITGDNNMTTD